MAKLKIASDTVLLTAEVVSPWLGIDFGAITADETANIATAAAAAQRWAEGYLGVALGSKMISAYYEKWPDAGVFDLPLGGITSIENIQYRDFAGDVASASGSDFGFVDAWTAMQAFPILDIEDFPFQLSPFYKDSIMFQYSAGFATAAEVDPRIIQSMLLKIKYWYTNRADAALTTDDTADLRTATELLDQVLREIQS